MPHSGMPGTPTGPHPASTSTVCGVTRQRRVVDPGQHVVVAAEAQPPARGAAAAAGVAAERLDHRAVRRQRAADHAERAACAQRVGWRADGAGGRRGGSRRRRRSCRPPTVPRAGEQVAGELAQQGGNAAGRVEVLHQRRRRTARRRPARARPRRAWRCPPAGTPARPAPPSRPGGSPRWSSRRPRSARRSALTNESAAEHRLRPQVRQHRADRAAGLPAARPPATLLPGRDRRGPGHHQAEHLATARAIVDAVPIVLQAPRPQLRQCSNSAHPASSSRPARRSSHMRHSAVPVPTGWPRKLRDRPGAAGDQDASGRSR